VPQELDQDVVGAIGRVSVPIDNDRAGEVMIPVRGGVEAYQALADQIIRKNARVVVIEIISGRTVRVEPF
jgi:hypothetical protein